MASGMGLFPLLLTAIAVLFVQLAHGNIASYVPSKGMGAAYSINIPEDTASSGLGSIYMQLKAPSDVRWIALGQGSRMTSGNLFLVYAASEDNVTLSTRSALGHTEPVYNPYIQASLLDGSGIENGTMTANVRCDNCMRLYDGAHILNSTNSWIWAMNKGKPLYSTNVSYPITQHDWHGIFSINQQNAVGGNSENPFAVPDDEGVNYTVGYVSEQQINDSSLHKKRIAHGVMTSVAFVLLFPNFGLTLYLFPSRWTVPWIHAPLQMFAVALALAGAVIGIYVSIDLQDHVSYHSMIGYFAVGGVVFVQPALGIIQHLRFRKIKKSTLYGVVHRWLGRFLSALGILNGGLGFHYAPTKNPDIPPASPIAYGLISGTMGAIYIGVLFWKRYIPRLRARRAAQMPFPESKEAAVTKSASTSTSTLCDDPDTTDVSLEKGVVP